MTSESTNQSQTLLKLIRLIAAADRTRVSQMLKSSPSLAKARVQVGASAQEAEDYFLKEICHYVYAGDTALHIAAAAFDFGLVRELIGLGADIAATNRRGAQPLHYASDTNREEFDVQAKTIRVLCTAGADPNAVDKSGVAPLHRAVRTRSVTAVKALLESGANPRLKNKSGSTPLHLSVQNTGRGGTGEPGAVERQRLIILMLVEHGARLTDKDGKGNTVPAVAQSAWIQALLDELVNKS